MWGENVVLPLFNIYYCKSTCNSIKTNAAHAGVTLLCFRTTTLVKISTKLGSHPDAEKGKEEFAKSRAVVHNLTGAYNNYSRPIFCSARSFNISQQLFSL